MAFDQCLQLRPDDPLALLPIAFDESRRNNPVRAAELLIKVAKMQPHALQSVGASELLSVLRQLTYAGAGGVRDTLIDTLVDSGVARDEPAAFSTFVKTSIANRVQAGQIDAAQRLLPSIVDPQSGVAMLIDRRYAPIWPALEQWAGMDLSVQRRALLAAARGSFEREATAITRVNYAEALAATGHRDAALTLIEGWLAETPVQDEGWEHSRATVSMARWLAEKGQRGVAIARMKASLKDWGKNNTNLGNIVPNLAAHQILARDYGGAIDTLDRYSLASADLESPAAAGYFVALRACALNGLGKATQAQAALQRVRIEYPTATRALDYATACVADRDTQARHWIARANDPDTRGETLVAMVTARYRKRLNRPSLTLDEDMLRQIEARADVMRAFDALARALSAAYEPALDSFDMVPERRADASGPLA